MKKTLLITLSLFATLFANAQVFWFENWTGTNCATGCTTYTGPNGTWTSASTGANGADANLWFFSYAEQGMGRTVCGQAGSNGSPCTAHLASVATAPFISLGCPGGDCGAVNDDGPSCITNLRIESPVINCTGKTNIKLSFNYIMAGAAGHDSGTVWYYNGATWNYLLKPAPSVFNVGCSGQGEWTYTSVTLPASANNNANVKIGFNWKNDGSSTADGAFPNDAPSLAVDSISISGQVILGLNELYSNANVNVYPNPNNGKFTIEADGLNTSGTFEVYNVLGEKVYSQNLEQVKGNNTIDLSGRSSGVYFYKLIDQTGTQIKNGKFVIN